MHFRYQWASRVNHAKVPQVRLFSHRGRNSMRTEDQHGPNRHVFHRFDKDGPAAPQLLDYITVVHDLMVHIHRRTVGFHRQLDDIHRPNHAGAKSTGPDSQELLAFPYGAVGQRHTSYESLKTLIISYSRHVTLSDFLYSDL